MLYIVRYFISWSPLSIDIWFCYRLHCIHCNGDRVRGIQSLLLSVSYRAQVSRYQSMLKIY